MRIPIQIQGKRLDRFSKVFFRYLEKDVEFEELIKNARNKLTLSIKVFNGSEELDITYKQPKTLRSEIKNIKTFNSSVIYFGNSELEKQLEVIIEQYPFIKDWESGISHFICDDKFLIDSDYYPIRLSVRNKKYPYKGRLTDRPSEEGVKIVINGIISKNELKKWIGNNYAQIRSLLKEIQSSSVNDPRRENFERDRLIVYLRDKWQLSWGKIAKILVAEGERGADYKILQTRVMKAYKEFPSKIQPLLTN